ncbi:unnamed protein product [Linum trigynum]
MVAAEQSNLQAVAIEAVSTTVVPSSTPQACALSLAAAEAPRDGEHKHDGASQITPSIIILALSEHIHEARPTLIPNLDDGTLFCLIDCVDMEKVERYVGSGSYLDHLSSGWKFRRKTFHFGKLEEDILMGELKEEQKAMLSMRKSPIIGRTWMYESPWEKYEIVGSYGSQCCTVIDPARRAVNAGVRRKGDASPNATLGKDMFLWALKLGFDEGVFYYDRKTKGGQLGFETEEGKQGVGLPKTRWELRKGECRGSSYVRIICIYGVEEFVVTPKVGLEWVVRSGFDEEKYMTHIGFRGPGDFVASELQKEYKETAASAVTMAGNLSRVSASRVVPRMFAASVETLFALADITEGETACGAGISAQMRSSFNRSKYGMKMKCRVVNEECNDGSLVGGQWLGEIIKEKEFASNAKVQKGEIKNIIISIEVVEYESTVESSELTIDGLARGAVVFMNATHGVEAQLRHFVA